MKIAKHYKILHRPGHGASTPTQGAKSPTTANISAPAIVASAFGKLDCKRRASLLGSLLGSVGPLALSVLGGGAFAKFLPSARSPAVPVSFDDAALTTSSQVYELVRYVEQSNPNLIDGLMTTLLQDGMVLTAIGASIAAVAIRQISDRRGRVVTSKGKR